MENEEKIKKAPFNGEQVRNAINLCCFISVVATLYSVAYTNVACIFGQISCHTKSDI